MIKPSCLQIVEKSGKSWEWLFVTDSGLCQTLEGKTTTSFLELFLFRNGQIGKVVTVISTYVVNLTEMRLHSNCARRSVRCGLYTVSILEELVKKRLWFGIFVLLLGWLHILTVAGWRDKELREVATSNMENHNQRCKPSCPNNGTTGSPYRRINRWGRVSQSTHTCRQVELLLYVCWLSAGKELPYRNTILKKYATKIYMGS